MVYDTYVTFTVQGGCEIFYGETKRWCAINYKLMQQVYRMLSSSICSCLQGTHEFHQENHLQASSPKQIIFSSKFTQGFSLVLLYF